MRIASIDIMRGLTMLLMIWVNDFWTLTRIPKWLKHAGATEDYLGFSDIIFPLFLFIVGLSIPYAIENRLRKGDSKVDILFHIIVRSVSLLVIGVYMVNYETINDELVITGRNYWVLLMAIAVFLIWMQWKKSNIPQKLHIYLRASGFIILVFLAIIYRGGENGEIWMRTQWWGILGLIGWAYVINSIIFLYAKEDYKLLITAIVFLIFNILSVLSQIDPFNTNNIIISLFSTLYSGTIPAFTTAGILVSILHIKLREKHLSKYYLILASTGIATIIYGLVTRPIWGISKIQATPSWLAICIGIGILSFLIFHWIADIKNKTQWAKIIAPAGTATLTCYMIPYFVYPIRQIIGIRLPDFLNTSFVGLLISFGFALLVVIFTGWLEKKHLRLVL